MQFGIMVHLENLIRGHGIWANGIRDNGVESSIADYTFKLFCGQLGI